METAMEIIALLLPDQGRIGHHLFQACLVLTPLLTTTGATTTAGNNKRIYQHATIILIYLLILLFLWYMKTSVLNTLLTE